MSYKIYLANEKNEGFNIPVLPQEINFTVESDNESLNVINLGEVTSINKNKLFEIEFESFFPTSNAPYVSTTTFLRPWEYNKKILEWMRDKQKVRFIYTGGVTINELVSIESYEYQEKGGEVGDIYYSISLKKYQPYSAKKVKVQVEQKNSGNGSNSSNRPSQPQSGRFYTVVKGDCLWNIAKRYYGNGALYTKIYDANTNKIADPHWIYPGQKLRIP